MLLGSCCGCDLSLVKAGIAVGLLDILSMVSQILLRWKHFSGMKILRRKCFLINFSKITF